MAIFSIVICLLPHVEPATKKSGNLTGIKHDVMKPTTGIAKSLLI